MPIKLFDEQYGHYVSEKNLNLIKDYNEDSIKYISSPRPPPLDEDYAEYQILTLRMFKSREFRK